LQWIDPSAVPRNAGPAPPIATVSTGSAANVAVTVVLPVMVNGHRPVPVQGPLQPENTNPVPGLAWRFSGVPLAKDWTHVVPAPVETQSIGGGPSNVPGGVTLPLPTILMVRAGSENARLKDSDPVTVNVHGAVLPGHGVPSNQLSKKLCASGVGVSVTVAPSTKLRLQPDSPPLTEQARIGLAEIVPPPSEKLPSEIVSIGAKVAATFWSTPMSILHVKGPDA